MFVRYSLLTTSNRTLRVPKQSTFFQSPSPKLLLVVHHLLYIANYAPPENSKIHDTLLQCSECNSLNMKEKGPAFWVYDEDA